jgi:integrase/recombinase XerD
MSRMQAALQDYIVIRRTMGFKFEDSAKLLSGFVAQLERDGSQVITSAAAVAWASAAGGHPNWWGKRLSMVRGFARYLHALDSQQEVPAAGIFPTRPCRATPHLYSQADVARLMVACRSLRPASWARTMETLIGLLAATGMRIGEVIRLDITDIDWSSGLLTVRSSKFGKSREVPLHPSTVAALQAYSEQCRPMRRRLRTTSFFVSTFGERLNYGSVHRTFHRLVRQLGLQSQSPHQSPRLHDLRHTFAVRTLLDWYRDGADVGRRLQLLSTYLGHIDPSATYWYLSAAPELLALAAERLEPVDGELS